MKKNNSNGFVVILILIIVGAAVFLLPILNEKMANGNSLNKNKNATYNCTLEKNDKILDAKVTRKVVFTIEDGSVKKYTYNSTYIYNDVDKYNSKKSEKINDEEGIEIKVSSDDDTMTYKKEIKADITKAEANNLDFPIKQAELENFVKNKGYECNY